MTSALVVGIDDRRRAFSCCRSRSRRWASTPSLGWVISGIGALCIAFALAQLLAPAATASRRNIERGIRSDRRPSSSPGRSGSPTGSRNAAAGDRLRPRPCRGSARASAGRGSSSLRNRRGWSLLTAVNASGVRAAGGLALVTVAIKLLPLLAVIGCSWSSRRRAAAAFEPLAAGPDQLRQRRRRDRADLLRVDRL